jgi:hypothetical protein
MPPSNYKKKRFCNRQCWLGHYNTTDREHTLKGAQASAKHPHGRGEGEANWYVKEGVQHQHRTVAERILGRKLETKEIVHHEDRNKKNNDPSNLIVFKSQTDHMHHHKMCINRRRSCACDCIRLGGDAT